MIKLILQVCGRLEVADLFLPLRLQLRLVRQRRDPAKVTVALPPLR